MKVTDSVLGAALLTGGIALVLLLFPATVQSVCLNNTFIAVTSALIEPTERVPRYNDCLSDNSPLLTGERGRLRLFQMNLALAGPEAAEPILAEISPDTVAGRLAHVGLGRAYLATGDEDAAIVAWTEAGALLNLTNTGWQAYETGQYEKALKMWQAARELWRQRGLQAPEEEKQALLVLEYLTRMWTEENAFELAAEAWVESVALQPHNVQSYLNAGEAYRRGAHTEQARVWFEKARVMAPGEPKPYYFLGLVAGDENKWQEAVAYQLRAIERDPALVSAWYHLGRAYERTGEYQLARDAYERILQLEPNNSKASSRLELLPEP